MDKTTKDKLLKFQIDEIERLMELKDVNMYRLRKDVSQTIQYYERNILTFYTMMQLYSYLDMPEMSICRYYSNIYAKTFAYVD